MASKNTKILSAIFCELRYNYTMEALNEYSNNQANKMFFQLVDNNKLGIGEGIVFFTGKQPSKQQILNYMKRNIKKLHAKKNIVGHYPVYGSLISRTEIYHKTEK